MQEVSPRETRESREKTTRENTKYPFSHVRSLVKQINFYWINCGLDLIITSFILSAIYVQVLDTTKLLFQKIPTSLTVLR